MKKGILAIVVAVAVVGGALFAFKAMKSSTTGPGGVSDMGVSTSKVEKAVTDVLMPKGQVAIADVVPGDAIVFVSARNARSTWDLIKNSNFWIKASALKIWETAQIGTGFTVFKEQFKANMGFEFTEETLFGLFGQDFSLALVGGKEGQGNPQLLILAQTDPKTDIKGKFDALIEKAKANATVESSEYNGQKITRVRNPQAPGPEFNYGFIGDLFVLGVGTDDSGVRSVVDLVAKKATNSLSSTNQYKEAVGTLKVRGDLRGVVFVNMTGVVSMLKALPTPEGTPAGFAANLEQSLGAIKSIAAAIGFDHGMLIKLFFAKNKEGQSSQLLEGWNAAPKEATSARFLPEDSLLLSITNSLNFANIWDGWTTNLQNQSPDQAKAILDAVAAFEKDSGLNIKNDILPLLGDELCFAITNVDMGGLFPFPHIAILAKVNDEGKALSTMQKLTDYAVKHSVPAGVTPAAEGGAEPAPSVKTGKEAYNGTDINFLEIQLPFQSLNPSYSVSKGFLVIGINKDTVKNVLDVAGGSKNSVVKSKAYQESTVNFNSKVNQVAFLNMDRTVALVIEITKWANNLQKARGETSAQTEQVIQDNVIPFLETMKVFKAIALEAVNQDNGIEETLYLQMEDLKEK